MTAKENTLLKAKASVSWIYSNILGKTVEAQLRTAKEIAQAREEYVSWVSYLLPIEQALTELEELKRYPTADEVCKALGELIGDEVRFISGKFYYLHKGATSHFLDSGVRAFTLEQLLKVPHLIILIGRFYEGLEKVGKEE